MTDYCPETAITLSYTPHAFLECDLTTSSTEGVHLESVQA